MSTRTSRVAALLLSLMFVGSSVVLASGYDSDNELSDRVRGDLEHVHIKDLDVQVLGWEVTLGGTAESLGQVERAVKIASGRTGVKEVFSNLQIERVPDETLRRAVIDALEKDRHHYTVYDLVRVSVEDGRVFLSGHAVDASASEAIGERVEKVRGVNAVDNGIDTSPMSRADEDLQTTIVLDINSALNPYLEARPSIHVMVKDGHVSLSGYLQGAEAREAVEKAVRSAEGVSSVSNELRDRTAAW